MKERRTRKDDELLIKLGQRIREIRKEKKITDETINETLGIVIYKYEKAELNITLTILALICKYLKVSLSEMLDGFESSLPFKE